MQESLLIVMLRGVGERRKRCLDPGKKDLPRSKRAEEKWWKKVKVGQPVPMTFIKVPYTASSKLVKKFQEVTRKHNFPIKFVEMSGYSLQNLLERSDPFRKKKCGRSECFPCTSGGGGRCDKLGRAYSLTCQKQKCVAAGVRYDGECFRPSFTRGREHLRGLKRACYGSTASMITRVEAMSNSK